MNIEQFAGRTVAVIGDYMLDRFVEGSVNRISPEAPCPVLLYGSQTQKAGGAGNVAANLRALGAEVLAFGITGQDDAGKDLRTLLARLGVVTTGLLPLRHRPTTVKTRFLDGSHHLLRFDNEVTYDISSEEATELVIKVNVMLEAIQVGCIVLSDYDKGVLRNSVIESVVHEARRRGIPVVADPKVRHFWGYEGVTVLKPNLVELIAQVGEVGTEALLKGGMDRIREKLGCESVVVTRGDVGLSVCTAQSYKAIPAKKVEVSELTGAGDTVAAVLALCLAAGMDIFRAAEVANHAASLVVQKIGTATVCLEELVEAFG